MGFLKEVGDSIQDGLKNNGIYSVNDAARMALNGSEGTLKKIQAEKDYKEKAKVEPATLQGNKPMDYDQIVNQASSNAEQGIFSVEVTDRIAVGLKNDVAEALANSISGKPVQGAGKREGLVTYNDGDVNVSVATNFNNSVGVLAQSNLGSIAKAGSETKATLIAVKDGNEAKVMAGFSLKY